MLELWNRSSDDARDSKQGTDKREANKDLNKNTDDARKHNRDEIRVLSDEGKDDTASSAHNGTG